MDEIYVPASDDIEDLEEYRPGGLHPIVIGDSLKSERYHIRHKLGYGASATVWLVYDQRDSQHVAAKVFSAEESSQNREIAIHSNISKARDREKELGIVQLLDHFMINGPNGCHVCLILSLHGPSIRSLESIKFEPATIKRLALILVKAVKFLHDQNVVAGDLSTTNVLLDTVSFDTFSKQELYQKLGKPKPEPVKLVDDSAKRFHAPRWVYPPVNWNDLEVSLLVPRVVLTDLNEAIHPTISSQDEATGIQPRFAAPENMLGVNRVHSKSSDIWALACCLYELRTRRHLVRSEYPDDYAFEVQHLFGPLPKVYHSCEVFTEAGEPLLTSQDLKASENTLVHRLHKAFECDEWYYMTEEQRRENLLWLARDQKCNPYSSEFDIEGKLKTGPVPPARMSQKEFADFHNLMTSMTRFLPDQRSDIDTVLSHPWLNRQYRDHDKMDNWAMKYDAYKHKYTGIVEVSEGETSNAAEIESTPVHEELCVQKDQMMISADGGHQVQPTGKPRVSLSGDKCVLNAGLEHADSKRSYEA